MSEESLHHARETGGNADRGSGGKGFQPFIAMRGHLAEIGYGLETGTAVAQALQDLVFDDLGDYLGIGAAAVEEFGGSAQDERKRSSGAAFAVKREDMQSDSAGESGELIVRG